MQERPVRGEMPFPGSRDHTPGGAPKEGRLIMARLYTSAIHRNHWIASVAGVGWFMFPARENGWEDRQPARGLDPLYLREVPAKLGENAGFPQYGRETVLERVA